MHKVIQTTKQVQKVDFLHSTMEPPEWGLFVIKQSANTTEKSKRRLCNTIKPCAYLQHLVYNTYYVTPDDSLKINFRVVTNTNVWVTYADWVHEGIKSRRFAGY